MTGSCKERERCEETIPRHRAGLFTHRLSPGKRPSGSGMSALLRQRDAVVEEEAPCLVRSHLATYYSPSVSSSEKGENSG